MTKVGIASAAITVAVGGRCPARSHVAAQTAQDLVGTWTAISVKADQGGNGRDLWPQSKEI